MVAVTVLANAWIDSISFSIEDEHSVVICVVFAVKIGRIDSPRTEDFGCVKQQYRTHEQKSVYMNELRTNFYSCLIAVEPPIQCSTVARTIFDAMCT